LTTNDSKSKFSLGELSPILCGLGLLLLALGLSFAYIEQAIRPVASGLTGFGTLAIVVFSYLMLKNRSEGITPSHNIKLSMRARSKRLVVVVTMVLGSVISIGTTHYFSGSSAIRWDLTKDQQHTLSKNTIDFISSLKSELTLTALYVGVPPKYLEDLFKEYERLSSGLISTQIVDPIKQIAFAATLGNIVNADERKVIIQSGDSRKDVDFTQGTLSEEKLTNAIARVSRAPRQVYFLTGHGEYAIDNAENVGLSIFKQLLADNNINSKTLMLGISQSIPEDCDVLIIAGSRSELTESEDQLISDYLFAGGDALFLVEHTVVTTPNKPLTELQEEQNPSLNSILNQWGLHIRSDIIVDTSNHVGDDVGSPATKNYSRHKAITEGLDYTFYVRPRSIQVLENRRKSLKIAPIVLTQSADNSWAESNRTLAIAFDKGVDTPGPVPFSYVVYEENTNSKQTNTLSDSSATRLIVFTDADFLSNSYINQYSNAQMGLNSVNWLAEMDYQVFLGSKTIQVERLYLTSKQKRQIAVMLFLLPFFFVVTGWVVWLRAKMNR